MAYILGRQNNRSLHLETALYAAANQLITYEQTETLLTSLQHSPINYWYAISTTNNHAASAIAQALLPAALEQSDDTFSQIFIRAGLAPGSRMLDRGPDLGHLLRPGTRVIDRLAYTGRLDLFIPAFKSLSYYYDTSTVDALQGSALDYAIRGGRLEVLRFLISQAVSLTVKNHEGYRSWWRWSDVADGNGTVHALTIAATQSDPELMQCILNTDPDRELAVEICSHALRAACKYKRKENAQILLLNFGYGVIDQLCVQVFFRESRAAIGLMDSCTDLDATSDIVSGSALHVASRHGDASVVTALLSRGARVDVAGSNIYRSPLQEAIRRRDVQIFWLLFEASSKLELEANHPSELLWSLAYSLQSHTSADDTKPYDDANEYEIAKILLRCGANVHHVPLWHDVSSLEFAMVTVSSRFTKLFLQHDTDTAPREKNAKLAKALRRAIRYKLTGIRANNEENIKALLEAGASPLVQVGEDFDIREEAQILLRHACLDSHVADILAEYIHSSYLKSCCICGISRAASDNDLQLLKRLLETETDYDLNEPCPDETELDSSFDCEIWDGDPLGHAASNETFDMARLLVAHGADIDSSDPASVLESAAGCGNLHIVQWALSQGASADISSASEGMTPLQSASWNGHLAVVKVLLESKANIEAQGDRGPALCCATKGAHIDIVRLLLQSGADIEATDRYSPTALGIASERGYFDIALLLLEHGANVEGCEKRPTPLELAAENGRLDIVQLLLNAGAGAKRSNALERAREQGHMAVYGLLREQTFDPDV